MTMFSSIDAPKAVTTDPVPDAEATKADAIPEESTLAVTGLGFPKNQP